MVKPAGIRRAIGVAVLCLLAAAGWSGRLCRAEAAKAASPLGERKEAAQGLTFLREFSSAGDFGPAHPVVDKTLDVVAGPNSADPFANSLQLPYAVAAGPGRRVYVTDIVARKVHVFDFGHLKYSRLQDGGRLHRPVGVATDQEGNVYVSDSDTRSVLVFDAKGKFRRYLNKRTGDESYFASPQGLAVDPASGRIYVCDASRHMVVALDNEGHVLGHFGKRGGGTGAGEFRYPTQVAVAGGELFVLDAGSRRVQVLDLQGHFRQRLEVPETDRPAGLAVDSGGRIYVSDTALNRIQVYSREGRFLRSLGQLGSKPGEFDGPSGMWLDSGRYLYVVDSRNKRVELFELGSAKGGAGR